MKIVKIILVLLCIINTMGSTAQSLYPSPERVQSLLNQLESCRKNQESFKGEMAKIKANPDNYTYERYLSVKDAIKFTETCITSLKNYLDELRKDYPEWFNNSGVIVQLDKGEKMTARELEALIVAFNTSFKNLQAQFDAIPVPKH